MAETPIIDAVVRNYIAAVGRIDTEINMRWARPRIEDVLRAALPWELPAERLEAMARTYNPTSWAKIDQWKSIRPHDASALLANCLEFAVDAYRADPIMRELYPAQFR